MSGALKLGEDADESQWRALVEQALKGAPWPGLVNETADGIALAPLYRETDIATAEDVSGFAGAAPFVRGARAQPGWLIRQRVDQGDPIAANRAALAELKGGAGSLEIVLDPEGARGVLVGNGAALDVVLDGVILEAAPIALDAGADGLGVAEMLATKLKGASGAGAAFNVDPLGVLIRTGAMSEGDVRDAARFALQMRAALPGASALRVDARPVHEAGGTEAQEIASALGAGVYYLRALADAGLAPDTAGDALLFTVSVDADALVQSAKLRALRLCWARVMQACGAAPESRAAHIHAMTSRRMMARYDAWTNIVRVTCAGMGAAFGGADVLTTLPFTDALGRPKAFARRLARNTQHILLEEAHLGRVGDPAGGSWFVEKLTRDLAGLAWEKFQTIEAQGGIEAALRTGSVQRDIGTARGARQQRFATRAEIITGVTDFPLLGASGPEIEAPYAPLDGAALGALAPVRWAAPFETLRDRAAAAHKPALVFLLRSGASAAQVQIARNLLAIGGIGVVEADSAAAFGTSGACVAAACGDDIAGLARALKGAGADWVIGVGKPGANEAALRAAGVDQFLYDGQDVVAALETVHAGLGIGA